MGWWPLSFLCYDQNCYYDHRAYYLWDMVELAMTCSLSLFAGDRYDTPRPPAIKGPCYLL